MTHSDSHSVPPEARTPLPPKGLPTAPSAMGGMGSTGPITIVDLAALNGGEVNGQSDEDV